MEEPYIIDIIAKANYIVQQDQIFKLRRMYNEHHSEADKKFEQDLHDTHQKTAWDEVKEYILENREDVLTYRQRATPKEQGIIDTIFGVIDDEINEIILKD